MSPHKAIPRPQERFVRCPLTWATYALVGYFAYLETALGPLMPFLRAEHDFSYTVASLHFSAFALGAVPVGFFGDRVAGRLGAAGEPLGRRSGHGRGRAAPGDEPRNAGDGPRHALDGNLRRAAPHNDAGDTRRYACEVERRRHHRVQRRGECLRDTGLPGCRSLRGFKLGLARGPDPTR